MWNVLFTNNFDSWLSEQSSELQERILAALQNLKVYGPRLPRPMLIILEVQNIPI